MALDVRGVGMLKAQRINAWIAEHRPKPVLDRDAGSIPPETCKTL